MFIRLSDVLDGWLARKKRITSEFDARLDSIAVLLFYGVLLIRMLPLLYQMLPGEIWHFAHCKKYHIIHITNACNRKQK